MTKVYINKWAMSFDCGEFSVENKVDHLIKLCREDVPVLSCSVFMFLRS